MKKSKARKLLPGITIGHNIPDVSKDPYFVEKHERARAFIAEHPIPEDWAKKKK
jgi:hypothetical protein